MKLFWLVIWFNLKATFLSFGGGSIAFPVIKKYSVNQYHWLDEKEFDKLFVAASLLPGPSVMEALSYISMKKLGKIKGSIACLIGVYPHILFAIAIYILGFNYLDPKWMYAINAAVMPVVLGLLLNFGIKYFKSSISGVGLTLSVLISSFVIIFGLFVPAPFNITALLMFLAIIFMYILGIFKNRKNKGGDI